MAKKHRKKNKRARAATLVGLIAAVIIAVVLYSQEVKLRAIYAEQAELEEVIACPSPLAARLSLPQALPARHIWLSA